MSFKLSSRKWVKKTRCIEPVEISIITMLSACFLLQACNSKQESTQTTGGETIFETAQSSFVKITQSGGKLHYEKSETRFDVVEWVGLAPQKLLLSITQKENRELSQDENSEKQFTVSVKSVDGEKSEWTKELKAADIDYSAKVLSVHYPAADNEDDTYTFYNIKNGEKIMDFTYGESKAIIPNTSEKRFFAYLSKNNALKKEIKEDGIIQYASSEKLIQQVSIKSKGSVKIPDYTPDIQCLTMRESGNQLTPDGKTVLLTQLNQTYKTEDITGFAFQITYYSEGGENEYKLIFPVTDDRLDVKNAIFDKTLFELKEI